MTNETSFFQRAVAGFAAVAVTMSILVSYFATPQAQSVAGILA